MSLFFAKNFKYSEVRCPCGCGKDRPLKPGMTFALQALRNRVDSPIYITSGGGIRCIEYNKKIGGYIRSPHLIGSAVDIHSRAYDIVTLAKYAVEAGFLRVGLYPYNNFIHVDVEMPSPSKSWVRNKRGHYKYFLTVKEAIAWIDKLDV